MAVGLCRSAGPLVHSKRALTVSSSKSTAPLLTLALPLVWGIANMCHTRGWGFLFQATLEQPRYEGHAREQLRAEVALFERALDRAQKFAVDVAKLNLEDRLVRLTEAQARMLAQYAEAALQVCGLKDRLDLRHAIAEQLRLAAPADELPYRLPRPGGWQ